MERKRVVWRCDCRSRGGQFPLSARSVTNESQIQERVKVMRNLAIAALLAGTLFVPVAVSAQVQLNNPVWRDTSYNGGEFAVDLIGVGGSPDYYTFALERNEGLQFGVAYDYTVAPGAVGGGLGGGNPDPISAGTTWLYERFISGTLAGYSYATGNAAANAARAASGRLLQDAIWSLEEEEAIDLTNPFVIQVVNAYGGVGNAMADAVGDSIWVVNPTAPGGGDAIGSFLSPVDQPPGGVIPEGKVWLSLLPLGLAAGVTVHRRRAQARGDA